MKITGQYLEVPSTLWKNNKTKYVFQQESGDLFYRTYSNLKYDDWPKDFLKELQDIAKKNKGTVEEKTYHGSGKLHKFAHKGGTEFFFIRPNNLKNAGWPINHLGILRDIAESHGGKLESKIWLGNNKPHEFINKDGISFSMTPAFLKAKKGGWPEDIDKFFRLSPKYDNAVHCMEYMRKIAKEKGGQLLSEIWKGVDAKYEFKDQLDLEFEVSYNALTTMGQWSPNRGLVSEPVCRQAMKHLFSQDGLDAPEFLSTRKVVTREGEWSLELDGYAEKTEEYGWSHSIAFEYQGHPGHQTDEEGAMKRDQYKKEFCDKNNIVLVVIELFEQKYNWESTYVSNHIIEAIKLAYEGKEQSMPELNQADFKVDMNIHHVVNSFEELRKIAEDNGGRLLSTEWFGNNEYHEFEYADGTPFSATPYFLKKKGGGWPKDIVFYINMSEAVRMTCEEHLEKLRELGKINGVKLTSEEWLGSKEHYKFEYADGIHFSMRPDQLKKYGLTKAQKEHLAKQEDITCELDEEYNCFAMG